MLEAIVERRFCRIVKQLGGKTYKLQGQRNAPDRLVMLPFGIVVLVELKRPGEKPRPAQLREHARLRALGQRVLVFDGVNWSEIYTQLRKAVTMGACDKRR